MPRKATSSVIRLRGVRQNNLKNIDLDLPTNRLHVVTGLSGSGKSSLAFDTLFAEGQRRYIETFSPYARQFFDRMDKPSVDSIEGIPPAIALEQRNAVRTTRSTVGTMTEICDYMKLVWPHLAQLHCRQCRRPVRKDTPASIWPALLPGSDVLVTFDLPLSSKLSSEETLHLIRRQGYQRILIASQIARLEECPALPAAGTLTVVQDRLRLTPTSRSRFAEACEQAFHFGKGRLSIHPDPADLGVRLRFSQGLHCATCDIDYREPTPALFSFNHPLGACPACRGFGRIITIDYDLALPDHSKTIAQGVVKPWQTGQGAECQTDLMRFARKRGVPVDVPFAELPAPWRAWVIEGDPEYGTDKEHEWPRAWYGIKGYFRWLESKAYKMHVRVLLSRYRSYSTCPDCQGRRFQPDALLYRFVEPSPETDPTSRDPQPSPSLGSPGGISDGIDLARFYAMPIDDALVWITRRVNHRRNGPRDPLELALREVQSRLACLVDVGLGYLTLDRATRTLSGGETQRVNLTSCLGTRLVNTLYVLDEPSVGLHPRDTHRLVRVLGSLRDMGNTVVVVEHEANVIQAADHITDLGPGQGERGGQVVFQGSYAELLKSRVSLTGQYMSGAKDIATPQRRLVTDSTPDLKISKACRHNLKNLDVVVPLGRLVCVTGVSGSGKTTLVREIIHPLLCRALRQREAAAPDEAEETEVSAAPARNVAVLRGWERMGHVVMVDQSPIGRTPRSNPAVYTGAFDAIRELFAQTPEARQKGLKASAFSFNSSQGQCERCRGAGFEKIEMQFLSDVFVRCPQCNGKRYRPHVLEIRLPLPRRAAVPSSDSSSRTRRRVEPPPISWSIADFLAATIDDTVTIMALLGNTRPALQALRILQLLQQVGLGYLRLGQPLSTLSGGENQRLKLAGHLVESRVSDRTDEKPTLFIFDEPTTGLHFDDVRVLLQVFQHLVDTGNSVLVVEHNLETIRAADWVIDLGPEAGEAGGRVVVAGPPEIVAACASSHTGAALRSSTVARSAPAGVSGRLSSIRR